MICCSCLQNVPDLVGPEKDLCPECYGFVAEDLIPSLLKGLAESEGEEHDAFLQEFPEELLDADDLEGPPGYSPCEGDTEVVPTFQGRPRF